MSRAAASAPGRVELEPIDLRHALAIQRLASDPTIGATSNVTVPYPSDGAVRFIRQAVRQWRAGKDFVFAVVASGEAVGACSLLGVGGVPRGAELGYWIGRPYWGRGYATDAARRVVGFGFRDLALQRIRSSCLVRNPASGRVLQKVGFRQKGIGGNPDPKWKPTDRFVLFELSRSDWLRSPQTGS